MSGYEEDALASLLPVSAKSSNKNAFQWDAYCPLLTVSQHALWLGGVPAGGVPAWGVPAWEVYLPRGVPAQVLTPLWTDRHL